jgi:uncharacterized membrane protein YdbT with pleckstrin-like domain
MPFPKRLLTEGEKIVLDLRPHWIELAGPAFATVVILAAVITAEVRLSLSTNASLGVVAAGFVLWCIVALPKIAKWATTRFVLTNERLISRSGVFAKRSKEIPLEVVNDITFRQTFFGRIVGAGTLVVESAGERGQESFSNIRRPETIQKEIYTASEARKGLGGGRTSGSVAEEIEKLAALRENGTITPEEFEARKRLLLES